MRALVARVLGVSALLVGEAATAQVPERSLPTRRELLSTLLGNPGVVFVIGASDAALTERYRRALHDAIESYFGEDEKARIVTEKDLTDEDRRTSTLYVLGSARQSALVRRLAPDLGIEFDDAGFRFGERRYDDPSDTIAMLRPSPFSPMRALVLYTGNGDDAILGHLFGFFTSEDYTVRRRGRVIRSGTFSQEPATHWAYDPARDRDLLAEREAYARSLRVIDAGSYRLHVPFGLATDDELRSAFERRSAARRAAFARTGIAEPSPPIDAFLYPTLEQKGKQSDDLHYSSLEESMLHSVFDGRFDALDVAIEIEAALPKAGSRALRVGAAVRAARRFDGRTLPEWASFLTRSDTLVSPLYLGSDERFRKHSYWFSHPSAALALEAGVAAISNRPFLGGPSSPPVAAPKPAPIPFMRGVCLAHTYSLDHGYVSRTAAEEIRRLHEGGVDWISITPFGYMGAKDRPDIRPGFRDRDSDGLVEENDESLWACIDAAHRASVKVLLVPHLWVRGAWCGEVAMQSDEDWRAFFEDYRAFTLHYAMLASMRGADAFCVGKELVGTTRARPEEWRRLISDVRRVFAGPITYAANWGEEFETLPFWDALDFAGLNEYHPLAETESPTDDALRDGAARVVDGIEPVARRIGKPIVITEAGYPSHRRAALSPWKDSADKIPDPLLQARCYRALVGALDGRPWLSGFFVWKWFTNPSTNVSRPTGYPIAGKPAESVLRDWFARPRTVPAPAR